MERYFLAFEKIVIYEFDVKDNTIMEAETQITFKRAGQDDMARLVQMRARDKNLGEDHIRKERYLVAVCDRLKSGHLCFVAEKNAEILGYVWAVFDEFFDSGISKRILLGRDEALLFDFYVSSSKKRKRNRGGTLVTGDSAT